MIRAHRASIRSWLLALAVLSVVPLAVFSGYVVDDLAQSRQELLAGDIADRSIAAANGVAQQLHQVETVLSVLANSNQLRAGQIASLRSEALQIQAANPTVRSFNLVGPSGRQVMTTAISVGQPMPEPDSPELCGRVFASGRTVLGGPFVGRVSNELSVSLGVPVFLGGRVSYCLTANLRIGTFTELLQKQNLPHDWTAALFDAKGIVIGRSKEPESFVGMAASEEVRELIAAGRRGLVDSVTKEGVPVRASLVEVPGWEWLVAVGVPRDSLYEPLYGQLGGVIVAGCLALIGAIVWALWLSGLIAGRVGQASLASVALREGRPLPPPDTRIRELDEMGDVLSTVGQLQEKLRSEQEQLRLLADSTSDMIARLDKDGRYVFVSAAAARIFGYSEDDLLGRPALEFVHPEDMSAVNAAIERVRRESRPTMVRFRRQHKNGHYIWVETALNSLRSMDGELSGFVVAVRDISAQKQVEDRLQLAASVFAETTEGIMITDVDSNIIDVNPAFTEITGYGRDDAIGRNPNFLQSGHHGEDFYRSMWATIRETGRWQGEVLNRRKDGAVQPVQMAITTIRDEDGRVIRYLGVFADISERKREQERMEHLAYHDALTRLPNRVLLSDRLEQALARAERSDGLVAVCYLDLDAFKPVNDQFGHKAGDAVLRCVARCLEAGVRGQDTVARLGGDEFVLVLDVRSNAEWEAIVDRVLSGIAEPCDIGDGRTATVTACVGVAVFPGDGRDAETLLRHADEALYAAKRTGQGKISLFAEIQSSLPKQTE